MTSNESMGELKQYAHRRLKRPLIASLIRYIRAFGRGLAANKTLTQLNVSSNKLLPEGIKVVCSDDL